MTARANRRLQPYDTDLAAIAALATTPFGRALLTYANEAAFKAGVNLEVGTDVQAHDADLDAIAALSTTGFGRAFLTYANEAAFKAGVNLEVGTDVQAHDADLDAIAALSTNVFGRSLLTMVNNAALTAEINGATDSAAGILETATEAEMEAGSATNKAVTPGQVQNHLGVVKWWWFGVIDTVPFTYRSYNVTSVSQPAGPGAGYMDITIATDFTNWQWCPFGVGYGEQRAVDIESVAAGGCRILRFRTTDGLKLNGIVGVGGLGIQ